MENFIGDAEEAIQTNNSELINNREDSVSAPLHEAMNTNSLNFLDVVSRDSGVDENATVYRRRGPLKCRSNEEKSEHLVVKLMKPDFDITSLTEKKCEALLRRYVKNGRINIAQLLIEKGVDINARDANGLTALHFAVLYDRYDAACMLLYYGVSTEIKSIYKETPFLLALRNNSYRRYAELLFDYVIDLKSINYRGENILYLALLLESPLIEKIFPHYDVESIVTCLKLATRKHYVMCKETSYVFKYLFPRVNHAKLVRKHVTILDDLLEVFCPYEEDFLECFYLVLSSDYAREFVEKCTLLSLIQKFFVHRTNQSNRMSCLYSLLSLGVDITIEAFSYIYKHFGFNEELEAIFETRPNIALHRYYYTNVRNALSVAYIIFYSYCGDGYVPLRPIIDLDDKNMLKDYLKFYTYTYHVKENYYGIESIEKVNQNNVPSLREVSRDAVRKSIISSELTQGCMYKVYDAIKTLPVPKIIQDILHLKQPLYV